MRWIAWFVCGLALALSTPASAVPLDPGGTVSIVIEQRAPGSLDWDLYLFSAPGAEVAAVNVSTTGFTSFEFDLTVVNLSLVDSIFNYHEVSGEGFLLLNTDPGSFTALGGSDDLDGLLLGAYTSALPTLESVALSGPFPVGASEPTGFPYPTDEVLGVIVPEPGFLAMLAVVAVAGARLRAAQHHSR